MAAEVAPIELAQLIDAAERPRAQQWSLRAALTRYAQPQPQRASAVIELIRRIESAIHPHMKRFEREGPAIWESVQSATAPSADDAVLVGVLRALLELDSLADDLTEWAVDRAGERPDARVDAVVAVVTDQLERLGVEREERPRLTGRRGGH